MNDKKNRNSHSPKKLLPLAVCLCVAIIAAVFLLSNSADPQESTPTNLFTPQQSTPASTSTPEETTPTTAPTPSETAAASAADGHIVWAEVPETGDYSSQAGKGKIVIAQSLKTAMEESDSINDFFAVKVSELTGATASDVYNTFVKPLDADEDYTKRGIVLLTERQINALEPNPDLSLVLSLSLLSYEVDIYLNLTDEDVAAQYKEQLAGLTGDAYRVKMNELRDIAESKLANEIIADYGIPEESVISIGRLILPRFTARLDTYTMEKLREDSRVGRVIMVTDIPGHDS